MSSTVTAETSQTIILSLRGKVLQKPARKSSHNDDEGDWTPYNGSLHMQGIKVLVNNPCPVVKKENAFEDTMFLIDLLKQSKEKENIKKKEDMIRNMALEQKRKNEEKSKSHVLNRI